MKKQSRFGRSGRTIILSLSVAALCSALSHTHADGGDMLFELAHTPVTDAKGTYKLFDPGDRPGDGPYDFLQYNPTQIGDSITFSVRLKKAGNYRVQTTTYKDGDEGIYSIEVDGKELGRKDFCEGNVWEVGTFDVKPGVYAVTYRYVAKNPKCSGAGVKFGNLHFR